MRDATGILVKYRSFLAAEVHDCNKERAYAAVASFPFGAISSSSSVSSSSPCIIASRRFRRGGRRLPAYVIPRCYFSVIFVQRERNAAKTKENKIIGNYRLARCVENPCVHSAVLTNDDQLSMPHLLSFLCSDVVFEGSRDNRFESSTKTSIYSITDVAFRGALHRTLSIPPRPFEKCPLVYPHIGEFRTKHASCERESLRFVRVGRGALTRARASACATPKSCRSCDADCSCVFFFKFNDLPRASVPRRDVSAKGKSITATVEQSR